MPDLVLAMTGASGSAYALRLLEVLVASGCNVHLTISPSAVQVLKVESGIEIDLGAFDPRQLETGGNLLGKVGTAPSRPSAVLDSVADSTANVIHAPKGTITYHHYRDFSAGIASGSFLTDGMVVCPCSMGTLSSIAAGQSQNLIHRAADVHLKERRKLILVPRETPLSVIALDNMKRLAEAGAVILPAMPGFYHEPQSIQDLIDFIVGRLCDQLGVKKGLMKRWSERPSV